MTKAAAEARRRYKREWARKNRDKIKAQQDRYWAKVAAAEKAAAEKVAQAAAQAAAQEAETEAEGA